MKNPHEILSRLMGSVERLEVDVTKLESENKELKDALKKIYKYQVEKHKEYETRIKICETNHKC